MYSRSLGVQRQLIRRLRNCAPHDHAEFPAIAAGSSVASCGRRQCRRKGCCSYRRGGGGWQEFHRDQFAPTRLGFALRRSVDGDSQRLLPFPQTPRIRVPAGKLLCKSRITELRKVWVPIRPGETPRKSLRLSAIVFPCYEHGGGTHLRPCSPAEAAVELLSQCLNRRDHPATAVPLVSPLVVAKQCLRLTYFDPPNAADRLIEVLDRTP
jgi:hypothetical protein